MRKILILLVVSLFLLSSTPLFLTPAFGASNTCSTTILHENGSNNAVQSAINSAEQGVTGPIVCVGGGTFPEQLAITSSNIQLIGKGTFSNPTIFQPTTVSTNAHDFDIGNQPIDAIIAVTGTASSSLSGVIIRNIVVNGSTASSSLSGGCGLDYIGILYQETSGTITNDTVSNIYLPLNLAGCQAGQGVYVETASGQTSTLTITGNVVTNYQKNGITCDDAGTTCTISRNSASFYTPYEPYIAPNGVQIAFGALGHVVHNTARNNVCTLAGICNSNLYDQNQGTGVITFESASGTTVTSNTLIGNDLGVGSYYDNGKLTVKTNTIESSTYAGIVQYDGNYVASKNTLANNPIGVAVLSDGAASYPATGSTNALSSIVGNVISGQTYSVQIQTTSPGTATVKFAGHTINVSGDSTVDMN